MNFFSRYIQYWLAGDKALKQAVCNIVGFMPGNISLYKLAFMHRSGGEIKNGIKISNERLEYLGDAVLGAVVAEVLFKKFPFKDEGFLTEMRSKIVNRVHFNRLGIKIGLEKLVQTSPDLNAKNRSLYGDAFEALVGAIYLDKGYEGARIFVIQRILKVHVDLDHLVNLEANFKSKLIEWAQKEKKSITFDLVEEIPATNGKLLKIKVYVDGIEKGTALDFSKKRAEQAAAEQACKELELS